MHTIYDKKVGQYSTNDPLLRQIKTQQSKSGRLTAINENTRGRTHYLSIRNALLKRALYTNQPLTTCRLEAIKTVNI